MAEAILEWSAGCGEDEDDDENEDEDGVGGQTPSPAELCSTTDVEGKSAVVYAKEHVRDVTASCSCVCKPLFYGSSAI